MMISLEGLSLGCECNCLGSTQSSNCSASCDVQGKRGEYEMVGDGK